MVVRTVVDLVMPGAAFIFLPIRGMENHTGDDST